MSSNSIEKSNSIENQESCYQRINVGGINTLSDIIQVPQTLFKNNISKISKNKFKFDYAFLCKECWDIPILIFMANHKILFKCKDNCVPNEISIRNIYKYLLKISKDSDKKALSILKCIHHPDERYSYYCKHCKKNICNKCLYKNKNLNKNLNKCKHQNKIILFNDENIMNKIKYVKEKIRQREPKKYHNNSFEAESENNNINSYDFNLLPNDNDEEEEENSFSIDSKDNNLIDDNEKEVIKNICEKNNDDKNYDIYDDFENIFSLIVYNYLNNTNFNHFETISNAEKYATILFNDFNKINLKYNIAQENKARNLLAILHDNFVYNNKENCFLLVGEKIFDLNKYIILSDIFDLKNSIIENYPDQIEVELIERKNKLMTDISFMFYGITSLNYESSFSNFDTTNITNMSYMFYGCSSMKKLPQGISNFKTLNVYNMSYMFYNCRSLEELPDGIKDWKVQKVEEINYMFSRCSSLISIPDISEWDVSHLKSMNGTFKDCISLTKLFDTKKWEDKVPRGVEQFYVKDNCPLLQLDKNYSCKIKKLFSKFFKRFKNKCFSKLYKPFIFFIKLIFYLCLALMILFLIIEIFLPFNEKEIKSYINNPNKYLDNYMNEMNITQEENNDALSILYNLLYEILNFKNFHLKEELEIKKLDYLFKPLTQKIENISKELNKTFDSFFEKEENNSINNTEENDTSIIISYNEKVSKYNSSQNFFESFNAITNIFVLIPIILLIYLFFKLNNLDKKKKELIFCVTLIFAIISVIFGFINYFNIRELYNISRDLLIQMETENGIESPEKISKEHYNKENYQAKNIAIISLSLIYILILIVNKCISERRNSVQNPYESENLLDIDEDD